jgi:hypothetical protein
MSDALVAAYVAAFLAHDQAAAAMEKLVDEVNKAAAALKGWNAPPTHYAEQFQPGPYPSAQAITQAMDRLTRTRQALWGLWKDIPEQHRKALQPPPGVST